ncbi:hypothetical protein [Zhongshania sp.]|uniref:hypothetical protein n=1 Tax=Zhongshania sp. TaxID=1971902 RepID=UPI001B4A667F|nr:hypothetical protein [Zhongshania sp.]MBQ0759274.1 hypothetical protein [Zhongshania sp.]MBQ0795692.1 hypothetical protein [Zhongshania sp.]
MKKQFFLDRTVIIARILSMYLLVTGLGFLISDGYYSKMITHSDSDPVLINLSGMVHFFIGATILTVHFLWKKPLQIIVTLLGLMFFLKGIFLIALPELTLQIGNNPAQNTWLMAVGFISAGIIIGYFSYFKSDKLHNKKIRPTQNTRD